MFVLWLFFSFQSVARGCDEYQCASLVQQNRSIKDLPEFETKGIFVIKELNRIVYIGKSTDCIRERMLSHLSGYDSQKVGVAMKKYSQQQKEENVTIGWVVLNSPSNKEHHYVNCLAKRQGEWPKYNQTRGRPPKQKWNYPNN